MQIITNHKPRLLLYWYELTPREQSEFGWCTSPDNESFVRYRGRVYCLSEFMRNDGNSPWYDGYATDSFFSSVLIRFVPDDSDRVIMGLGLC